ncbi:MAG: hypothetical protein RLZZ360_566 [Candidatus Parcubacteria bacterium]|jgi:hypothetical protein
MKEVTVGGLFLFASSTRSSILTGSVRLTDAVQVVVIFNKITDNLLK